VASGGAARRERPHAAGEVPAPPQPRRQRQRSNPVELDRLIHERVRLGIVSALALNDTLSFNELKKLLGATDGNLSVHARRLEEAGYIDCRKSFDGRVPRTDYGLTSAGRAALRRYLDHMEALIHRVREG
jgi:DNA-binding HxlR family transcriptional regulator